MPFFKAIGFGILLIIMSLMLPNVLSEIERTALVFLQGAQVSATTATSIIESANLPANVSSAGTTPRRLSLPQAPYPVPF